jgi:hypothetical protein
MGLSALLAGCGGGGGSASTTGASSTSSNQSVALTDQQVFEQFSLGTTQSYELSWFLPLSGTPSSALYYLTEVHASVAASPATAGTQPFNASTPTSLANTLSVPTVWVPGRYLINGAIVVGSLSLNNASYQNGVIKVDLLSADGTTVVDSKLRSNLSIVPLSGTVVSAPTEFAHWFNALYFNSALLNTSATWASGAAYLQYTATEAADTYTVADYSSTTTGNTPSPVATGTTISALMTAGGINSTSDATTYTLSNGTVSTINGVTTYVATAPRPNLTTTEYRTYYEVNGNVYTGSLIKAGTVIGGSAYPVGTSSSYTLNYSQRVQIRLNAAAVASLKAAVKF